MLKEQQESAAQLADETLKEKQLPPEEPRAENPQPPIRRSSRRFSRKHPRSKRDQKNVDNHCYFDDDDDLPDAIKLMDEISVGTKTKPKPRPPRKKGTLERLFDSATGTKKAPSATRTKSSPYGHAPVDDNLLAYGQVSLGGDLTLNQMIREVEQQEEDFLFGNDNPDAVNNKTGQQLVSDHQRNGPSTYHNLLPVKRSLLAAMNAGSDDKSTLESLAGQDTVNDILLKMEDDSFPSKYDHMEEGTIRTWTNFNPIATSIVSAPVDVDNCEYNYDDNQTAPSQTPSQLIRESTTDMIAAAAAAGVGPEKHGHGKGPATSATRKNYFVDDETSVGTFEQEIEVVVKNKHSDSQNDGDNASDDSIGNQNTMVSTLSFDETYYRMRAGVALPTDEAPWWVAAERVPNASALPNKENSSNSNGTPRPHERADIKVPATPTTWNSAINSDLTGAEVHCPPNLQGKSKDGQFLMEAIQGRNWIRWTIVLSALCFAAVAVLLVLMLLDEMNQDSASDELALVTPEPTIPPFNVTFDGQNVVFDMNGTNATTAEANGGATDNSSAATDSPSLSTTASSSAAATEAPGDAVVTDDVTADDYTNILLEVIRRRLPEVEEALQDPTSPQSRAFEWMTTNPPDEELLSQPMRIAQRWVLSVVFYSTNGEDWVDSTGWLSDANECTWYHTASGGIDCDENGLMKEINLRRNNLRGTIPKELILLSDSIESIQINGNFLDGTIPSFLSEMSRLGRLHLNGNEFTGTIPSVLGQLDLWSLRLGQMGLSGPLPSELGNLSNLRFLNLASNSLVGTIPYDVGRMTLLETLEIYNNDLTGTIPARVALMTSLVSLRLEQNDLVGSFPLGACIKLDAPEFVSIVVDCEEVSCSCCDGC
jgi:hypothetical protein